MKYDISIITPCFNPKRELFLKCIDSVKKQAFGFDKIEWLIIDDCSTDNNCEDLYSSLLQNKNVKVIKLLKNCGVGRARNVGIEKAGGEYVTFLDCDDYYCDVNVISDIVDVCRKTKCDFLNTTFIWNINNVNHNVSFPGFNYGEIAIVNNWKELLEGKFFCYAQPSTKIIKTEFLHSKKIKFTDYTNSEDSVFFADL